MRTRKAFASFAAGALTAVCLAAANTAPAHAAVEPSLEICNSINSVAPIEVWRTSDPQGGWIVYVGNCRTFAGQSSLRVDVDPDFGPDDVDSYYIGQEGEGYGPCHQGENDSSDPPNISPRYVKYNTNKGSC